LSKGTAMGRDKSVLRVSAMTGILDVGWMFPREIRRRILDDATAQPSAYIGVH
jgi:hypothetical protein